MSKHTKSCHSRAYLLKQAKGEYHLPWSDLDVQEGGNLYSDLSDEEVEVMSQEIRAGFNALRESIRNMINRIDEIVLEEDA